MRQRVVKTLHAKGLQGYGNKMDNQDDSGINLVNDGPQEKGEGPGDPSLPIDTTLDDLVLQFSQICASLMEIPESHKVMSLVC